jgi:hypothetical protein
MVKDIRAGYLPHGNQISEGKEVHTIIKLFTDIERAVDAHPLVTIAFIFWIELITILACFFFGVFPFTEFMK